MTRGQLLAPALLLMAFCGLAVSSMYGDSITGDEVAHLASGYTYVETRDFRLNTQHPPLIKALAGLPLLLLNLKPVEGSPGWDNADEWTYGRDFLLNNTRPQWLLVFLARLPMVGVGVLMGIFLFLWAKRLWGYWPGVFVLFLYAFEPNTLAHTRFVTTDVGVSCFTVLTLYLLWRFTRSGTGRHAVLCGGALGLALLSKYTGVVTAMLVAALLLVLLVSRQPSPNARNLSDGLPSGRPSRRPQKDAASSGRAGNTLKPNHTTAPPEEAPSRRIRSWHSVPYVTGIEPSPSPLAAEPLRGWHVRLTGWCFPAPLAAGLLIALLALALVSVGFGFPKGLANYYRGFTKIYADFNPKWEAFLWGEYSKTGFRYYYVLAELWKTPLPALLFFCSALFLIRLDEQERRLDWTFVLLPFAAFHAAGVFNHANIGVRHILPAFPFLLLACGAVAQWVAAQRPWHKAVFALLCVWYAAGTLRVYPHFLPYFNELAGGPEQGISYLDDSNVEWGQDFYRLKRYLEAAKPPTVRIEAFQPIRLEHYGIAHERMRLRDVVWPEAGVTYIAGASYLQRNSLSNEYPGVRFQWLQRYRPVHKIGWSLYVYRFSMDPADEHNPAVFFVPKAKWYADAIETLTPLVGSQPEFHEARRVLAEAHSARASWRAERGEWEAALLDVVDAINLNATVPRYRAQFRATITRLPALPVDDAVPAAVYFSEAEVHFRSHDRGPALLALLRCLQRNPNHVEAHLNLGTVFGQLGFPRLARSEWQRCLAINPGFVPAQRNLARLASVAPRDGAPAPAGVPAETRAP